MTTKTPAPTWVDSQNCDAQVLMDLTRIVWYEEYVHPFNNNEIAPGFAIDNLIVSAAHMFQKEHAGPSDYWDEDGFIEFDEAIDDFGGLVVELLQQHPENLKHFINGPNDDVLVQLVTAFRLQLAVTHS